MTKNNFIIPFGRLRNSVVQSVERNWDDKGRLDLVEYCEIDINDEDDEFIIVTYKRVHDND